MTVTTYPDHPVPFRLRARGLIGPTCADAHREPRPVAKPKTRSRASRRSGACSQYHWLDWLVKSLKRLQSPEAVIHANLKSLNRLI